MKTVLISGCSSGFGSLCAFAFAAAGYRVVATIRNMDKAAELRVVTKDYADTIDIRQLDVIDEDSIKNCVSSVVADYGAIDVLINNAGLHLLGAIEDMQSERLKLVFDTNVWGAVNLSRAVLPVMRQSGSGHIISISSLGSRVGRVADGAYCASKAALEMMMEAMHHEVVRFGVAVSVICPAAYNTPITQNCNLDAPYDTTSPYKDLIAFRMNKVRGSCENGGDPIEVAHKILEIAKNPTPEFRYVIGNRSAELNQKFTELDGLERSSFLRSFAGIEWWTSGAIPPK